MAKVTIPAITVLGWTARELTDAQGQKTGAKVFRTQAPNGYLQVGYELKSAIENGKVAAFTYDDEKPIKVMTGENRDIERDKYVLTPVLSNSGKFDLMAGSENLEVDTIDKFTAVNELINKTEF